MSTTYTEDEWLAEARRRFGPDPMEWAFVCPSCNHVAKTKDWKEAGAPAGGVAFACVGRWKPAAKAAFGRAGGPCNYTGGGLMRLNPVLVKHNDGNETQVFDFAQEPT